MSRYKPPTVLLAAIAAISMLAGGGIVWWSFWGNPSVRAARLLLEARSLQLAKQYIQAEQLAAFSFELDSTLGEAALCAAECAAAEHEYERAVSYCGRAHSSDPLVELRARLLAARLNYRHLHRLQDAENSYRDAIKLSADNVEANTGLVQLLALCGRKREAIPLILRLIRRGAGADLLVLLSIDSAAVDDPELLHQAHKAVPEDANPLLGLAWNAAADDRPDQAIDFLRTALRRHPGNSAAYVALGQQLLLQQRFDELGKWAGQAPASADEIAETWFVRAQMAEKSGNPKSAIRCYWEGIRRAPESKVAHFHLARLLAEFNQPDMSERFVQHVRRLQELEAVQHRVLYSRDHGSVDPLLELAKSYEAVGRLWESYGWCMLAVQLEDSHRDARRYLEHLQQRVAEIPLRLTVDSANVALSVDLSNYPLPHFVETVTSESTVAPSKSLGSFSFREEAALVGLEFSYFNGTAGPPRQRMFELTGGGVGVIDFDQDGFSDVYFTQGRPWPPDTQPSIYGDRLFRNRYGSHFEDVTAQAGIVETGFGQGISVGDFNSDGFPDVYVANIGANQLWLNHGDGTFEDVTVEAGVAGNEWTTSCVMADLDGDGLSDIYAVNYVTARDVFDRVCRHADGSAKLCMPFDFVGQPDRLWLNGGNRQFTDVTKDALPEEPNGMGLGVAVWDAHGNGRLDLLVANDTTPNFFYVNESNDNSPFRLHDRAIEAGLALNGAGKATGCMGIGLGDIDDDGRLDIHITNFLGEPNTLYTNSSVGYYEDRSRALGLHDSSLHMLGFGTQFLDVDLDGRLELFVSNGHIDDLSTYGKPYRMPCQLFRLNGQHFEEVGASEIGPYFALKWLGRAVVRIDWDRNGREDLVVGHLGDPSALLTNTTSNSGKYLSLNLHGVLSNRDAIGTTAVVKAGKRTLVRQMTAGDGYQASNERRLTFGVGPVDQVDELIVRWPSGITQRFEQIPTSRELTLIEGKTPIVNSIMEQ